MTTLEQAESTIDSFLRAVAALPDVKQPQPFFGTARFEPFRELGRGTFGVVYEALDRRTGSRVAVKVLRFSDPSWVLRFKREFRSLSEVAHGNVVRIHELERDGDQWLFSMDLVDGCHLLDAVRANPGSIADVFEQLMDGVAALHSAGIIHCDLKPSNVLVDGNGRVTILDFGLAVRSDERRPEEVGGTPAYMAPEQVAGEPVGFGADWYAVGLMLFEALSGHHPFVGRPLSDRVVAAPTLGEGEQPELRALANRLLRRAPAQRVRDEEEERFIGRADELAAIHDCFSASGGVVEVIGPSGVGKSALVSHYLRLSGERSLILTARCREQEFIPFQALDGVVDELAHHVARLDEPDTNALFDHETILAAELFPSLGHVLGHPRSELAATPAERARVFVSFKRLFSRLTSQQRVVVAIDDLHWADRDSLALLSELIDVEGLRLIFTRRDDTSRPHASGTGDAADWCQGHRSGVGRRWTQVLVGPLPQSDARVAIAARFSELSADAVSALALESGGLPFLFRVPGRKYASISSGLEGMLRAQVDSLQPEAREFLELLSIATAPLEPEFVRKCAQPGSRFASVLAVLRDERLAKSGGGLLEPYHDRVRTAVADGLSSERARALHLRLAAMLVEARGDDAAIGHHFNGAGEDGKASHHAELAAMLALSALAFDAAATQFERAWRWAEEGERSTRLREAWARALANAGHGIKAGELFIDLAADSPQREFELRRDGVDALLVSGAIERGMAEAQQLATMVDLPFPKDAGSATSKTLLELSWVALRHRLGLRVASGRDQRNRADVAAAVFRGLLPLAPAHAGYFAVKELSLALDFEEPHRFLLALARVGSGFLGPGPSWLAQIGAQLVGHARAQSTSDDADLAGALDIAHGAMAFWDGHWAPALERIVRGLERLSASRTPVTHERNIAQVMIIRCLEELGRWDEAAERNQALSRDASHRGDLYSSVTAGLNAAFGALVRDEPLETERMVNEALARWPLGMESLQHVYGLRATLHARLMTGRNEEAWQRILEAWPSIRRGMHLMTRPGAVDLWLLRARATLAAGNTTEARLCASELARAGRQDGLAHFHLVSGCAAALEGDTLVALLRLAEARRQYAELSMASAVEVIDYWRSRLDGQLGERHLARLEAAGVSAPRAWAALYAPGVSSSVAQNAR